ncbi:MAG: hypothetical protein R6U55_06110, partial [Desulfovermiculus sp.]
MHAVEKCGINHGVASTLQGNLEVSYAGESTVTTVIGVSESYGRVRNSKVEEGQFITENHLLSRSSV